MYTSNGLKSADSCLFGHKSDLQSQIYKLNNRCGIDKHKLSVLLNPERNFLSRATDILLVDPIGRFANAVGGTADRTQRCLAITKNLDASITYAQRDILHRKVATALFGAYTLCSLHFFLKSDVIVSELILLSSILGICLFCMVSACLFFLNSKNTIT